LTELYEKLVLHYKKKHEMEIDLINNTINNLKLRKNSEYKNIENINSRTAELKNEIGFITANTKMLSQERKKFISSYTQEDNILQALLYSNTIQQNLTLTNTYKDEINTFLQKREDVLQKISDFDKNISTAMIKIENITFNKDIIKNIHVIQQPTFDPKPVKPKIKLRILLAIIAGLFFMIFLAFLIEYIKKEEKK
jgi:capsular polysaccharide biosynthesis protein